MISPSGENLTQDTVIVFPSHLGDGISLSSAKERSRARLRCQASVIPAPNSFDHPSRWLIGVVLGKQDRDVGEQPQNGEGIDQRMRTVEDDASKSADQDRDENHELPPQRKVSELFDPCEWAIAQAGETGKNPMTTKTAAPAPPRESR